MPVFITPLTAGLLTLVYIFLSSRVINIRHSQRIALGDGGNRRLQRRIRAHGNFAEYVPLALLLLLMLELMGAAPWLIAGLGLLLLTGRSLHAYSVSQDPEPLPFRVAGMILTFTTLSVAALANLVLALDAAFTSGAPV